MHNDRIASLLEDFLWAGSSGLLIALSRLAPSLTPIALIALVPFLWRATAVTWKRAIVLGALLAFSYSVVSVPIPITADVWALRQVVIPLILFVTFAVAVNALTRRIGPNIVLTAALWLPAEYLLDILAPFGGVFGMASANSAVFVRIGSLFGTLMVSFLAVLINTLLLAVVVRVIQARPCRPEAPACASGGWAYVPVCHIFFALLYPLPLRRGPPRLAAIH